MDNLCRQPIQNPIILYKKTVIAEAIICENLVNVSDSCDCTPNTSTACFIIVVENGNVVSQN